MANKRQFKKRVQYLCGSIADELQFTQFIVKGLSDDVVTEIMYNIAVLQAETVMHVSVSFDKVPHDFDNRSEYNKARRRYYRAAFAHLRQEMYEKANAILKKINSEVPADQRKLLASLA